MWNWTPFILDTAASQSAVGAVLSQKMTDGKEHPVAFASRTLTKAEKNCSRTKKEMLAVVHFVHYFRHYLAGSTANDVRTDHQALRSYRASSSSPTQPKEKRRLLEITSVYFVQMGATSERTS